MFGSGYYSSVITGPYLSPDETHPFQLELYTILTCKAINGRKGTLIVMTEGMEDCKVISVIIRIEKKSCLPKK
jgi:hypothetical protein